jgi:hypothetical protein
MSYRYGQSPAYAGSGRKGLAPALPLWTPANAGAAVLGWFDASDAGSITLNGASVSAWANKGTAGGSLVQATASIQPGYSATGWDGTLPCLSGDGVDSGTVISAAIAGLVGNFWLFLSTERAAQSDINTNSTFRTALCCGEAAGYRSIMGVIRPSVDPGQQQMGVQVVGGTSALVYGLPSGAKGLMFGDLRATVQTASNGSSPTGAGTHGSTDAASDFCLFGDSRIATASQRGRRYAGKIFEAIVVNPALLAGGGTAAERQRIEGYMAWHGKYASMLQTDHPYRYFAPHL